MKMQRVMIFEAKKQKKAENKIRPANAIFDGVVKPFVRGAVKNLNPRKGTETKYNPHQ